MSKRRGRPRKPVDLREYRRLRAEDEKDWRQIGQLLGASRATINRALSREADENRKAPCPKFQGEVN